VSQVVSYRFLIATLLNPEFTVGIYCKFWVKLLQLLQKGKIFEI